MIRFVDLRPADTGYRFAFWDTVTNHFVSNDDDQAWDTWADFEESNRVSSEDGRDPHPLERFRGLCPAWVFEPAPDDAGPKWHFIVHVEHDGDESVVYFAHEAREVERWQRLADAAGLELGAWLARLADREVLQAERKEAEVQERIERHAAAGQELTCPDCEARPHEPHKYFCPRPVGSGRGPLPAHLGFVGEARAARHAASWSKASATRRPIVSTCAGCNGLIVLGEAYRCFGCGNVYATSERLDGSKP